MIYAWVCRIDDRKNVNINRGGILYSPLHHIGKLYTCIYILYLYIALDYIIYAIPIGRTAVRRIVVLGEHKYTYVCTYIYMYIVHTRTRKII